MSNVLIGIIGVILLIGLALAGALFLGPRFQDSTNNSKASTAVQAVTQVAHSANMYRLQEGVPIDPASAIPTLVSSGYLKSAPINPVSQSEPMNVTDNGGSYAAGAVPTLVLMSLGSDADAVCTAIARQTGQNPAATTSPTANFPASTSNAGCYKRSTIFVIPWMLNGNYYVYARL